MVIWIFDYCSASVERLSLTEQSQREYETKYNSDAEWFLSDKGYKMDCVGCMVTDDYVELEDKEI